MGSFDQQKQTVDTQLNVGGTANIEHVGDHVEGSKHESIIYNTNLTLVSTERKIQQLLSLPLPILKDPQLQELLKPLIVEHERDQLDHGFVREEVDVEETLLSRLSKLLNSQQEPTYKTNLPFLRNGTVFLNRFKIRGFVGRGGFADAYIAWDMVRDQESILKRLNYDSQQEAYLNRFVSRERVIAARLRETRLPGIVHTYDVLNERGEVCLVQEHIPGQSLHDRLETKGALSIAEAITTTIKVCEALQNLHNNGIIHCDIKPLNIIISSPGNPTIIDLGTSRFIGETITADEITVSPFYSPPEQYGVGSFDGRLDIYALGITFLQMITGLPDISEVVLGEMVVQNSEGESVRIYETMPGELAISDLPTQEILRQHSENSLNTIWPPHLQNIIRQAIADYDQRFGSAAEFKSTLIEFRQINPEI